MDFVLYERTGSVGVLTINRPEALNALNGAVIEQLSSMLDEIAASCPNCLIVTGAGAKAFVAGADIGEMKDMNPQEAKLLSAAGNSVMEKLESLPAPVIAAVNGYALGGGCELALSCDIRIASENAVFGLPETGLGVIPGYGGIQRLIRSVGLAKAKELIFTAGRVSAAEALEIGLVNAVCHAGELMETALRMAGKIAANAPVAVRAAKKTANESLGLSLSEAARLETEPFAACFATRDQKQAMAAFSEKRKPEPFEGT